jgi:hypothetical protein
MEAVMENVIDLAVINPRNGPQFSLNLFRFLRKRGVAWANICRVYRDTDNIMWIGSLDNGWLHGARLMVVLCYGSGEQLFAYAPGRIAGLTEVPNFWEEYMRIGRCAIDPEHRRSFMDDETRWAVSDDGKHRSCLWCGNAHQKRETWVEQVQHERWVAGEQGKV